MIPEFVGFLSLRVEDFDIRSKDGDDDDYKTRSYWSLIKELAKSEVLNF